MLFLNTNAISSTKVEYASIFGRKLPLYPGIHCMSKRNKSLWTEYSKKKERKKANFPPGCRQKIGSFAHTVQNLPQILCAISMKRILCPGGRLGWPAGIPAPEIQIRMGKFVGSWDFKGIVLMMPKEQQEQPALQVHPNLHFLSL